ncbi:MAG: hypothetical protein PHW01_02750 [Patescibacteria group bacterium]|nr:hypothetical protein [Patescibacteria group bacterium]
MSEQTNGELNLELLFKKLRLWTKFQKIEPQDYIEPRYPQNPKLEEEVGEMNDEQKKLFTLIDRKQTIIEEILTNIDKSALSDADFQFKVEKNSKLQRLAKTVNLLLPTLITLIFDANPKIDRKEKIALRQGFKITKLKRETRTLFQAQNLVTIILPLTDGSGVTEIPYLMSYN